MHVRYLIDWLIPVSTCLLLVRGIFFLVCSKSWRCSGRTAHRGEPASIVEGFLGVNSRLVHLSQPFDGLLKTDSLQWPPSRCK